MDNGNKAGSAPLQALAVDWLIWSYVPAAIIYLFRNELHGHAYTLWLYLGSVALGLILALVLSKVGDTLGARAVGWSAVEEGAEAAPHHAVPWYRTLVGVTSLILAVVTFVLGWNITEINLYYVFTRADRLT
ncbi:MAG: hypothetical protein GXY79_09325, partial [Chloroflexi bacterium]|nr:hypothetical protein [Chloroflexota bacterium]